MIREYVAEDLEIPNASVDENATSVSAKAQVPTSTPSDVPPLSGIVRQQVDTSYTVEFHTNHDIGLYPTLPRDWRASKHGCGFLVRKTMG